MDKLKQYLVFTMLGCLLVLVAGWFVLVSPKRGEAAELRTQAEGQVVANSGLETKLQMLKAQAKDLPKQQAKLAAVAAKIPDNPALPGLIRALTGAASSAGVELVSVSPGPVAAVAAAPVAGGAQVAPVGTTPTTTTTTTAAAAGGSAGTLAQIPLSLTVSGGYFQVEQFIANLENQPRSMRITGLNLAPGTNPVKPTVGTTVEDGKTLSTTITGQVYLATDRPPAAPVTVPGKAAGAATGAAATVTAPVAPAKK
jgi:type IV pilus assembly protein PilO